MLKMTRIELELISDNDMLFIYLRKKGMRGGISYVANNLVKQIMNTCNFMMIKNQIETLHILMQIVYMIGKRINIYHIMDLNG